MEMVDSSSDDELIVEAIKLGLPSRKKSLCV
ncbi:unnamed protein product [Larinioides sclopetarius]|uniref:Uncharacterized protein n=1 Tax=Larinioides sclopetarius TaxID=280406 RepID=A0AAV2BJL7_9ARAC